MSGDGFMTALGAVTNLLFVLGAVYIYLSLVRQIAARADAADEKHFGLPEVVLAGLMATLFGLNALLGSSEHGSVTLTTRDLFLNALISLSLLLFVYGFLTVRRIPVGALTGFAKLGFWRTLVTAIVLLLAAYPLIFVADQITQRLLGEPSSRQTIVELFSGSHTLEQRVIIIILAVAIAPLFEEYFFRFLLYSVIKRYFGRSVGLVANALLFALVHAHLPSAGPLFVLGSCFTVAFEWSGSILVPMTMHALFNSLTLTALAFPELVPQ